MSASFAGVLATPAAAVIGLLCFLVCGGLLAFRRNTLTKAVKIVLLVILAVSIVYLLFLLWLVVGFGRSNPGAAPTPR